MSVAARRTCPDDWLALEALYRRARRKLPRLWWWEEHLADDLFVLIEHDGVVTGALFAWPDESPVAWIRLAILDNGLDAAEWLNLALPPILDKLRCRGTQKLAWMDYDRWAGPHLRSFGFGRLTEVITLVKLNRALPDVRAIDAYLRPASDADVPAVVAIDQAAFTPHWWHSESTMLRRTAASAHFVVAEVSDGVVGYFEGELRLPVAHLNRIAVHPVHQGQGIGALLLRDALRAFWRLGAGQITLNTQTDNDYSRRLYRRFGFEPTGDAATVWELDLFEEEACPENIDHRKSGASRTR